MNARDYEGLFTEILSHYCLFLVSVLFVRSVYEWCRTEGYDEPDKDKPMKIIADKERGCKLVINEVIPENVVDLRINALGVRSSLINVAENRADTLNSDKKKLAYLFLVEYALTLPDLSDDEILADNWVFDEMNKQGFFKE